MSRVYERKSYCSDCCHRKICKYRDEVEQYDAKTQRNTTLGPVVSVRISCSEKLVLPEEIQNGSI